MSFNARGGCEVSKLKLCHWEGVKDGRWKRQKDFENFDEVEKKMAERVFLFAILKERKK